MDFRMVIHWMRLCVAYLFHVVYLHRVAKSYFDYQ